MDIEYIVKAIYTPEMIKELIAKDFATRPEVNLAGTVVCFNLSSEGNCPRPDETCILKNATATYAKKVEDRDGN